MNTLNGLKYALHVIVHPFDGFWDLKHEKRGNLKASAVFLVLLLVMLILRHQLTGFIFNDYKPEDINFVSEALNILIYFFLWCIANLAVSTLIDGKGQFRDIVMVTAYSLLPIILLNIPMLIISHVITLEEAALYTVLDGISVFWAALLLFIGTKTIHHFQLLKTVVFVLITILCMAIIAFLALLFLSLVQQMYNFVRLIYLELTM